MFDNIQSLYNQYLDGQPQKLTIGKDIRDQTLPFMFETFNINTSTTASGASSGAYLPSQQFILPINPESYRISYPTRTAFTPTLSSSFQDNIGLGFPKISIQGTFGYLGTLPGGHGKSITGRTVDSWALFQELETTFFDFYQRFGTYTLSGKKVTRPADLTKPPELYFYNFTDKEFWLVQVDKFELLRNVQRRFLYQYDIQMTGMQRLVGKPECTDTVMDTINQPKPPDSSVLTVWNGLLKGYAQINSVISGVVNAINGIKQDVTTLDISVTAFRQGISDVIAAPFGLVTSTITSIDNIIATANSISDVPQEFIGQMRKMKRDLLLLYIHEDKFYVSSSTTGTVSATGTPSTATEIVTTMVPQTLINQGTAACMDTPETTIFDPSLDSTQNLAVQEEPIKDNDSLESIAYRMLGDARQWQSIALLNGLEYPFIASGLNAFSPVLGSGTLDSDIEPGDNMAFVSNLDFNPGEIIVLDSGPEYATVESYAEGVVVTTSTFSNAYPAGTKVTRHASVLSVLQPGDKILIPGTATSSTSISGSVGTDFPTKLYGCDERLDKDGDQTAVDGDTETVSGVSNLVMQLRHRLMTIRGELAAVGHPDYGSYLPLIIGKTDTPVWLQRAQLEAEITILQDPRIDKVENVVIARTGTTFYIEANVYPIGQSNSQQINIPMG